MEWNPFTAQIECRERIRITNQKKEYKKGSQIHNFKTQRVSGLQCFMSVYASRWLFGFMIVGLPDIWNISNDL